MARSVSSPSDSAATLRNLKVLVVLLVVSNILVGVLGVYLLRAVDRRYSELVGHSVPVLNDLRELMTDTVAAMRATNPIVLMGPESNRPAAIKTMDATRATAQQCLGKMQQNGSFTDHPATGEILGRSGEAFSQILVEVARLYAAGKDVEAVRHRDEKLRPAFDRHLAAIGKASDAVETLSLDVSKDYTSRTNSLTTIVLGVASWPVIMLIGVLLVTAAFVIAMMLAFRGKDLTDAQ